jgi:beta-phosphoglucomutase
MFRGIVFDMDGVIIDRHPVHRKAWQQFLHTLGKEVSEPDLDLLEGRKGHDILRHFFGDLSDAQLREYGKKKAKFFAEIRDQVQPAPGVVEFLHKLERSQIPTAVATSASKKRAERTLHLLQLTHHFRCIVTGDEVPVGKPDPAIYQLAAECLGLPAKDLLAIEDSARGVTAARAAGMRCIGVAQGERAQALRRAGVDHIMPDFLDLSIRRLQRSLLSSEVSRFS